jgi:lysophospholipase L1-like esterase
MGMLRRSTGLRLLRMILVGLILGALVAGGLLALPWIDVFITPTIVRKATIAFLIGLEIAYASAVAALLAGATVCSARFWRSRRNGTNGLSAARGLMLCISSLTAIGAAELIVDARRPLPKRAEMKAEIDAMLPVRFAETPSEPGLTIAVLGESSALGMPFEMRLSVGKIVAWQLEQAIPGKKLHVDMLAEPGDTLSGQYRKLSRLKRRPDALIVYCGHNEFSSEIPWSRKVDHYLDLRRSSRRFRDDLAAAFSPVCNLIRETAEKFRVGLVPPRGLRAPLVDSPAYTPAEYAGRLADFRRRLDAIASYSERIGALAILVVPPSNDAQFDPNRSFLPAETTRDGREAFAREFLTARRAETAEPARAAELYRTLLLKQPLFAETHYRLACLLERAGKWAEAYEQFIEARDLDGLPMRCMTPFQNAYRDVAASHDCVIVDGQALFHAIGPHGLLDDHLFMDAMHPSLRGQVALAQRILDAIAARGALGWPNSARAPRIDLVACAAHFALQASDWKLIARRGYMFQWGTVTLRHDRRQREAKMVQFADAAKRLADGEPAETLGLVNLGVVPADRR